LILAVLSVASASLPLEGQKPTRFQIEPHLGFLITFTEGHPDRPVAGFDVGFRLLEGRVGGHPGLTFTGGLGVGFAELFAELQSESFRAMGGVQIPWLLGRADASGRTLEIVPHIQAGYLSSNGGDERDGLVVRTSVGLRVPVGSGPIYLTFEPFALIVLPDGTPSIVTGAPSDAFTDEGSNAAIELGILTLGWRF